MLFYLPIWFFIHFLVFIEQFCEQRLQACSRNRHSRVFQVHGFSQLRHCKLTIILKIEWNVNSDQYDLGLWQKCINMENSTCRAMFCSPVAHTDAKAPTSNRKVFLFFKCLVKYNIVGGIWWMFLFGLYSRKWSSAIRDKIEMSLAYITAQNVQSKRKIAKEQIIRMVVETRLNKYILIATVKPTGVSGSLSQAWCDWKFKDGKVV